MARRLNMIAAKDCMTQQHRRTAPLPASSGKLVHSQDPGEAKGAEWSQLGASRQGGPVPQPHQNTQVPSFRKPDPALSSAAC